MSKVDFDVDCRSYLAEWKARIGQAKLTQDRVCDITGIAPSTLSLYISGDLMPRLDNFWMIESLLRKHKV